MDETLKELGAHVKEALPDAVEEVLVAYGELTLVASAAEVIKVLRFLRDDPSCRFVSFIDICGVDWPQREKRFDVVYHLQSPRQNLRIRVKVAT
ncbi:MAG: NADH-quinone oxidoreductase subunit C, partial [Starkeya sp.]|nr:NADH-quinone oxidoreductase subunit C [Starkeya sp.]